jgi:hypothetical protein
MSDADPVDVEIQDLMAKDDLTEAEDLRLHMLLQPRFNRPRFTPRWLWRLIRRRL